MRDNTTWLAIIMALSLVAALPELPNRIRDVVCQIMWTILLIPYVLLAILLAPKMGERIDP